MEHQVEKTCGNCKCCVFSPYLRKHQCVCKDKHNPKFPHVHVTELHFHCSTGQFEPK